MFRQLDYLVTLAQERHFARAAAICNVTQPTLSAGLKQLEETLGVLIVERGRRFVGLTAEGERVLAWAQRMLSDYDGLRQDLGLMQGGLVGRLQIGAIPVALPTLPLLTRAFAERHPLTNIVVISQTSKEIQRGLDAFSLDAGITYLDNEPLAGVRTLPLYEEHYVLLTPISGPFGARGAATWREASELPLCLLTPDMQNRRILDAHFRQAGATVRPMFETNSALMLLAHLRSGKLSTVLPHTLVSFIGPLDGFISVPLREPDVSHTVGLVLAEREPLQPLAQALLDCARGAGMAERLAFGL
jgi:DNA-binding transcriptional LysR family regulator